MRAGTLIAHLAALALVQSMALPNDPIAKDQQCGGKGGGCGSEDRCKDAPFPGVQCASGTSCQRVNEWHWQCNQGEGAPAQPTSAPAPTGETTTTASASSGDTSREIPQDGQCGGKGDGHPPGEAVNAQWPSVRCVAGSSCIAVNEWYWHCKPAGQTAATTQTPVPASSTRQSSDSIYGTLATLGMMPSNKPEIVSEVPTLHAIDSFRSGRRVPTTKSASSTTSDCTETLIVILKEPSGTSSKARTSRSNLTFGKSTSLKAGTMQTMAVTHF